MHSFFIKKILLNVIKVKNTLQKLSLFTRIIFQISKFCFIYFQITLLNIIIIIIFSGFRICIPDQVESINLITGTNYFHRFGYVIIMNRPTYSS